ncbi:MAG: tetratricopeptide repeat protein [Desulfobacterales bacterium]|nr:tetratricopeptide repeat protein [Desulfobacterales bacterium]
MLDKIKKHGILSLIFLLIITGVVYLKIINYSFILYDDDEYVTNNAIVKKGISLEGFKWAFQTFHADNWHPITWLSHMLDVEFFSMNSGAHHLTNLFFHLLSTALLFFILLKTTGAFFRSIFVSALFALHPMHVESVAWVSERKDVLSAFFFFITIFLYCSYVKKTSKLFYLASLVFFILGLMSKPMLVTLPFVLLIFDIWPLKRTSFSDLVSNKGLVLTLILEKLPFFFFSALSSAVTIMAQEKALVGTATYPFYQRVLNACISYLTYIYKAFVPTNLSVIYEINKLPAWWWALISFIILTLISIFAIKLSQRHSFFKVGWAFFLGTLIPVIGLVQVGFQTMNDRYTYIPFVGIFIIVSWGLYNIIVKISTRKIYVIFILLVISILTFITNWQIKTWKNTETVFLNAIAVTPNNYIAHINLGRDFLLKGRLEEAKKHFLTAVKFNAGSLEAFHNLASVYERQGNFKKAEESYKVALGIDEKAEKIYNNLGNTYAARKRFKEALEQYKKALIINPKYVLPMNNIGNIFLSLGNVDEAIKFFNFAIKEQPTYANPYVNLGNALLKKNMVNEAIGNYSHALKLDPNDPQAHYNLALAFKKIKKDNYTIKHLKIALSLDPNYIKAKVLLEKIR